MDFSKATKHRFKMVCKTWHQSAESDSYIQGGFAVHITVQHSLSNVLMHVSQVKYWYSMLQNNSGFVSQASCLDLRHLLLTVQTFVIGLQV